MVMEWIWVVLLITFFLFCLRFSYMRGRRKGYQEGASDVLVAWRETVDELDN